LVYHNNSPLPILYRTWARIAWPGSIRPRQIGYSGISVLLFPAFSDYNSANDRQTPDYRERADVLRSKSNDTPLDWYLRNATRLAVRNPYLNRYFSTSPTVDMYFRKPLQDDISGWKAMGAIRALGPNVFVSGNQAVIVRYANDRELAALDKLKPIQVIYVIDDLLTGAVGEHGLPADYSERLDAFTRDRLPRILEVATDIVAPSEMILDQYSGYSHALLGPCAMEICENFSHFADQSQPFKLVLSGTRSHRADSMTIIPALARLLKSDPGIHLTTFLGNHVPDELAGLAHCDHRVALPRPLYKRFLARQRFHVALYPTRDTAFNQARSWSKILDHAAFGAASLFSPHVAFRDHLTDGRNAELCPDPDSWIDAILALRGDRERALAIARAGADLAGDLGDPRISRKFWAQRLSLADGLTV